MVKVKGKSKKRIYMGVYSSVSPEVKGSNFFKDCERIGEIIAENNLTMSYSGSGQKGCASKLLDGVINKNGSARGVIYHKWEHFLDKRLLNPPSNFSSEIVLTNDDDLLDRIREIKRDCIAIIALPGGPGTFQEIWTSAVGIAELEHTPLILYNIDGFFDHTKKQIDVMSEYFNWEKYKHNIIFVDNIKDLENTVNLLAKISLSKSSNETIMDVLSLSKTPGKVYRPYPEKSSKKKKSKKLSKKLREKKSKFMII